MLTRIVNWIILLLHHKKNWITNEEIQKLMPHLEANFKDEQAECESKNEEAHGIYVLALEGPEKLVERTLYQGHRCCESSAIHTSIESLVRVAQNCKRTSRRNRTNRWRIIFGIVWRMANYTKPSRQMEDVFV